jgi:preprotein translocase subunit Sss1
MDDFPNNPFASSLNDESRHYHGDKLNRAGFLVAEPEWDEGTLELVDEDGFVVPPDPIELDHIFERVERVHSSNANDRFTSEQFAASFSEDLDDKMTEDGNDDTVQKIDDTVSSESFTEEGSASVNVEVVNKQEHVDKQLNRASVKEVFQFGSGPKKWGGLVLGLICAAISGLVYPVMAFVLSNTFRVLSAPTSDEFRGDIKEMAFIFMILGVVGFVSVATQITLLEIAAEEVRVVLNTFTFLLLLVCFILTKSYRSTSVYFVLVYR